jgi:type IV pilus assembly protein PilC
MSNFVYTARDAAGQSVSGSVVAASEAEASQQLRAEGKYPVSIRRGDAGAAGGAAGSSTSGAARRGGIKLPRKDVVQLTHQLSIMMETGVNLPDALDCILAQDCKPQVKALVEDLSTQVKSGVDFSTALGRHPRTFPRLFIALIVASEKSGMMSKLMARGTAYLRDEQETVRKVKGALTYPAIMLSFALLTTVFLLVFVLPRFTTIYATKKAALPVPTKVLMALSDFMVNYWMVLVPATVAAAVGLAFWLRTEKGQRAWHWVQLHVPVMGPMFRQLHLSRGLRMIGTMAGAGVPLNDCVGVTVDLADNAYFRELWTDVSLQIQSGKQLSEPLARSPYVPRSVAQMIHSGEKGGKLAPVMEQLAGFSEAELKEKISELTRYIEPAMIVLMGCLIGGVAMALLLPIFTISKVVAS